ncbi:MAG: hypothetical protein ACREJO_10925 [Phycisphaerales bacterium]
MNDRAACYIERAGGGDMILRLRYCDPRGSREWLAPGGLRQGAAAAENVLLAAAWIHEQVSGASSKLPLDIVLDLDGGVCGWLTTPGGDDKAVRGALAAAKAGVTSTGEERETAAVSWLDQGELGTDVSIQALSEGDAPAKAGGVAAAARHRLAVVCVPDLAARVLLDELDRLGTEVERVMSLWHALAAWEPGRRGEVFERGQSHDVVASSEPVTAVLVVEPTGKAIWSWVRDGRLLAGGSLRLKRVVSTTHHDEPAHTDEPEPTGALRRVGPAPSEPAQVLEASRADVGRIVSEWLAWSTQLGVAPGRLVCLGPWSVVPAGLAGEDLPDVSGIAAVGAAVGRAWPGTNVSAKVDEDAVASTLARLVRGPEGLAAAVDSTPRTTTDLVELSRRPGRTNRVLYRWLTLTLVAGSVVFVALGLRLGWGVGAVHKQADDLVLQRSTALAKVSDLVKIAPDEPDPVGVLTAKLRAIQKERSAIKPDEPLLAEFSRFLMAVDGLPDTQLMSLTMNAARDGIEIGRLAFKLDKDNKENLAGALFKDRLITLPPATKRWITWNITIPVATADREEYNMIGRWTDTPAKLPEPSVKPLPPKPPAENPPTDAPKTDDGKHGETVPPEAKPADGKPPEAKATETKAVETKHVESKPAENSVEPKSDAPKSPEAKATPKMSGGKPAAPGKDKP